MQYLDNERFSKEYDYIKYSFSIIIIIRID